MKRFKQLIKELPARKVVFAFGRFQPPTTGHELLVNAVKKIAAKQGADHYIFASRTQDKKQNPLPVDRKVYYLNRMFPKTNFVAANEEIRTFIEAAAMLSKKYKHLVMVAGSDRVANFKELLEKYNGKNYDFETIEVVSAGERDPDSDTATGMSGTKMREAAKKGDFASFKKGLPHNITELDGKRLMNEIRQGLGIEAIKEQITFDRSSIREQYHAGSIFNVGDKVTDGESNYEIVDRGANYLTVVNEHGDISKKWLDSVTPIEINEDILPGPVPEEVTFKGYTTKNLHHSEDAIRAFTTTIDRYNKGQIKDPVAILNALKATDTYMKVNDLHLEQGKSPDENEIATWLEAHSKARDSLNRIGEFMHHFDYWHMHEHELQDLNTTYNADLPSVEMADSYNPQGSLTEMKYSSADKIKVARVIASALGVEDVEKSSNPEQLINTALRKIRSKPMRPEYIDVVHKMLMTADEAAIAYDKKLVPQKVQTVDEDSQLDELSTDLLARYKKAASKDATAADQRGDFERGNKRFSGIIKATKKQFANDAKMREEVDISHALHQAAVAKMMGKDGVDAKRKLRAARMGQDEKENDSDLHADAGKEPQTTIAHSLHNPEKESPSARSMKIAYVEDVTTSEYKLSHYTDDEGHTKTRKVRPHKVTFAASKKGGEPEVQDVGDFKEALASTTADIPPEDEDEVVGLTNTVGSKDKKDARPGFYREEAEEDEYEDDDSDAEDEDEDESEEDEHLEDIDDMTDSDLDDIVDDVEDEEDVLDAYDDEELALVDDETGEKVEEIKEEVLNEILSRMERIKAKARFARTKAKRERRISIALKSRSTASTLNNRARRLAVNLMKQRIAKKPLAQLSIGEKERLERTLKKRKAVINRLAMKLVPRIRKIENDRLTHKSFTK